jgi:hypothetical protein
LVFLFSSAVNSLYLECSYSNTDLFGRIPGYGCDGKIIKIGDPHLIEGVSQTHLSGRKNSDVILLRMDGKPLGTLPNNVGSFFPNLEGYQCKSAGITELTKENFMDLPNLKQLEFYDNKIQEIGNIFGNNPKIYIIQFGKNPLKHISYQAFAHLSKLDVFHLESTPCMDDYINSDRQAVLEMLSTLKRTCPPSQQMLDDESGQLNKELEDQIAKRTNHLLLAIEKQGKVIEELKEQVQQLEKKVQVLMEMA